MGNENGTFPELVIELPSLGNRPSSNGSTSPLAQTVDKALREVLAWRPRTDDGQGFVAALNQAFSGKEIDGRIEYRWEPRSFAIQADMGAVTGAQASIYARARAALDQSLPLLAGLYALDPAADKEDVENMRALVRDQFTELVNEFGMVGGPRLQRLDNYFDVLLGAEFSFKKETNPEDVGGLLGRLCEVFGLDRERANEIDKERNLTNAFIIIDNVVALRQSLDTYRSSFERPNTKAFLGTHLVIISRLLAVVAESVEELNFVMDSVFLSAAERQTVLLPFVDDEPQLTIEELLTWTQRLAVDEGPRLIRDAGRDGVVALGSGVNRLKTLIGGARKVAELKSSNPTPGFHTERVRQAWQSLDTHVSNLADRISEIKGADAPVVTSVTDNTGQQGAAEVDIKVNGRNFLPNHPKIRLVTNSYEIAGENVEFITANELKATVNLTGAPAGKFQVIVENSDGAQSLGNGVGSQFTVSPLPPVKPSPPVPPAPTVSMLDETEGDPGESYIITILGENFAENAVVAFGPEIETVKTSRLNDRAILAGIKIDAYAKPGPRDVTVANASTDSGTLQGGFTVTDPAGILSGSGAQSQTPNASPAAGNPSAPSVKP